jgi:hypothetical protein
MSVPPHKERRVDRDIDLFRFNQASAAPSLIQLALAGVK